MRTRLLLGGAGLLAGLFGAWSLLSLGLSNLLDTVLWLAGGVVAHDALLASVTIALVTLGTALTPARLRAPVAAGLVVLGTVTLAAVPVLGRFGARADNPTLLDRGYLGGWLLLLALVCAGVAATAVLAGRRRDR